MQVANVPSLSLTHIAESGYALNTYHMIYHVPNTVYQSGPDALKPCLVS